MTFRLGDGEDEAVFIDSDKRLQAEFAYQQPGLLRRTTARDGDGNWMVIDLWDSAENADACSERWDSDPVAQGFMRHIDRSTVVVARYTELD